MDCSYDCVILGTGLTECILSGLLSVDGKSVLHMDRNNYYGGACASLSLSQAWTDLGGKEQNGTFDPEIYGASRDWNIDLVTKFIMTQGKMVSILCHCDVARYLEFRSVDGSYVFVGKKIHKVPATEKEALSSGLMGIFEKYRFKDFLFFAVSYDPKNAKTHQNKDIKSMTAKQLLTQYKLDKATMDFIGHAMALYRDEHYLMQSAEEFILRVKLYADSLAHAVSVYNGRSPYLYPAYGLGDLPQAFARLASVFGGTYMLSKPFDGLTFNPDGTVSGVNSGGEVVACSAVIGDPSYFSEYVKPYGKMVRAICILDHPIPNTKDADSVQIVIPQHQVNRTSDIYINCISSTHNVASAGKYIAIASTTVSTSNPIAELEPAIALLGNIMKVWYNVIDLHEPTNLGEKRRIFVSKSYDPTPHFETVVDDVLRIYKQITGKDLDLTLKVKENP